MTMFLFPTCVNIFIFWITDNFLMNQKSKQAKTQNNDESDTDQELLLGENDNEDIII